MENKTLDHENRKDAGLKGNEKLEEQIGMLQKEPSPQLLAVVLTSVRRRMQEGGQMIVAVDAAAGTQMQVQIMQQEKGERWIPVYTSFEEEMKGGGAVFSTFMGDIGQLLRMALEDDSVQGLIINPWNRTLKLDKQLIRVILGSM